ncbi:hypothetical protein KIN20_015067 [Parelaphostrongylus tenuis]|uniref:Uncharacterized protein n=1 Tax=Parelaphostrongylus tenuis TaxID=148309 RepID=A0AAD5N3T8_PARTN|nr:hypothetical protein KIN20_015067 [Parelaphostrongylus tenuis]
MGTITVNLETADNTTLTNGEGRTTALNKSLQSKRKILVASNPMSGTKLTIVITLIATIIDNIGPIIAPLLRPILMRQRILVHSAGENSVIGYGAQIVREILIPGSL